MKILFLNKNDLFERKIQTSHIKTFFPASDIALPPSSQPFSFTPNQDFDGEKCDAEAGRLYFKKAFARLALKTRSGAKEREVYIVYVISSLFFWCARGSFMC